MTVLASLAGLAAGTVAPAGQAASSGTDLSILVAVAAGLISFLSPCVLPLVPAYLAQLTAVAVAGGGEGARPSRWLALSNAAAYVAGFGLVFTVLGLTATFAGGPLALALPGLRQLGGVVLIVMGLSLAGILRVGILNRVWRPLEAGAAASVAASTGTIAFGSPGQAAGITGTGAPVGSQLDRLGGRLVGRSGGHLASFGLGAIFAIGWTPCIGIILGGILTMAATSGSEAQGGLLLLAYTAGLGVPFLILGALYDRAPGLLRPLVRHGAVVSLVGGLLVVAIGLAMVMDWLILLPRYFNFNAAV
jgi:cytochrome c-type biogenesis protein